MRVRRPREQHDPFGTGHHRLEVSHDVRFRAAQRSLSHSLAFAVAKAAAVTGAILIGYVSTAVVADLGDLADGRQLPEVVQTDPAAALIAQHDCYTTGLGAEIPGSALVRRGDRVEQVTFVEGWAVHEGRLPGTLVAVCRAPVAP